MECEICERETETTCYGEHSSSFSVWDCCSSLTTHLRPTSLVKVWVTWREPLAFYPHDYGIRLTQKEHQMPRSRKCTICKKPTRIFNTEYFLPLHSSCERGEFTLEEK